jgi:hypothetical protein
MFVRRVKHAQKTLGRVISISVRKSALAVALLPVLWACSVDSKSRVSESAESRTDGGLPEPADSPSHQGHAEGGHCREVRSSCDFRNVPDVRDSTGQCFELIEISNANGASDLRLAWLSPGPDRVRHTDDDILRPTSGDLLKCRRGREK